jgi:hypothetical protein
MFDQFLRKWATQSGQAFHEFDARDYKLYVDGKPRYEGVRDFLKSREITLLEGSPRDSSSLETNLRAWATARMNSSTSVWLPLAPPHIQARSH